MGDLVVESFRLEADVRNVGVARRGLRDSLVSAGGQVHLDSAVLALSEIVTNAFVHTGGAVSVSVHATSEGVRVEVEDASPHLPVLHHYADTAGTGRGLQIIEEVTDRWGVRRSGAGKAVWFEIGRSHGDGVLDAGPPEDVRGSGEGVHPVTLRRAPLLMHWAWQEHAAALLREYLLHVLEHDETILERHAAASEAMSLLSRQLPVPQLPEDPDGLMAEALEPDVTAEEIVLDVPASSVAHFATLGDLLGRATQQARAGHFLGPPTQPEIEEMREWLCSEVAKQTSGHATATPWLARTDVRATLADRAQLRTTYAGLGDTGVPLLATDESSIIVAVSQAAVELLGYDRVEDLLGRRVLAVVPVRYHQAHIAGTTLHATNGRDVLLGVPLLVPMVRKDGLEVQVTLEVRAETLPTGHRVSVARFHPA